MTWRTLATVSPSRITAPTATWRTLATVTPAIIIERTGTWRTLATVTPNRITEPTTAWRTLATVTPEEITPPPPITGGATGCFSFTETTRGIAQHNVFTWIGPVPDGFRRRLPSPAVTFGTDYATIDDMVAGESSSTRSYSNIEHHTSSVCLDALVAIPPLAWYTLAAVTPAAITDPPHWRTLATVIPERIGPIHYGPPVRSPAWAGQGGYSLPQIDAPNAVDEFARVWFGPALNATIQLYKGIPGPTPEPPPDPTKPEEEDKDAETQEQGGPPPTPPPDPLPGLGTMDPLTQFTVEVLHELTDGGSTEYFRDEPGDLETLNFAVGLWGVWGTASGIVNLIGSRSFKDIDIDLVYQAYQLAERGLKLPVPRAHPTEGLCAQAVWLLHNLRPTPQQLVDACKMAVDYEIDKEVAAFIGPLEVKIARTNIWRRIHGPAGTRSERGPQTK